MKILQKIGYKPTLYPKNDHNHILIVIKVLSLGLIH